MVLLGCSVFINLAGIMFESGRFDSGTSYYDAQRSLLTWITIFVIVFSLIYLALVLGSEIMETMNAGKEQKEKKTSNESPAKNNYTKEVNMTPITEMCYNPMMVKDNKNDRKFNSNDTISEMPHKMINLNNADTVKLQEELVMLRQKVRLLETSKATSHSRKLMNKHSFSRVKKQHGFIRPNNVTSKPKIAP
eukprot:TRINITY_DN323_c0_g5_i1.p1 TRINITY_DN323_c0_g5~~TRINITY_DN323_c0_g5_i1.p1  ORF type:complete len:220 (+),score=45.12 TRINITY_DN323_c0_g5_i1:86-661(+)